MSNNTMSRARTIKAMFDGHKVIHVNEDGPFFLYMEDGIIRGSSGEIAHSSAPSSEGGYVIFTKVVPFFDWKEHRRYKLAEEVLDRDAPVYSIDHGKVRETVNGVSDYCAGRQISFFCDNECEEVHGE